MASEDGRGLWARRGRCGQTHSYTMLAYGYGEGGGLQHGERLAVHTALRQWLGLHNMRLQGADSQYAVGVQSARSDSRR